MPLKWEGCALKKTWVIWFVSTHHEKGLSDFGCLEKVDLCAGGLRRPRQCLARVTVSMTCGPGAPPLCRFTFGSARRLTGPLFPCVRDVGGPAVSGVDGSLTQPPPPEGEGQGEEWV